LIPLLAESSEIVASAAWALRVIARHDAGTDVRAWDSWWERNANRHRIEWLIDSLMADNDEIRRDAGDELKSITKEYFGYYDDLPKGDRALAQKRYRQWWEASGKARFTV
jgi:hypothetical protein